MKYCVVVDQVADRGVVSMLTSHASDRPSPRWTDNLQNRPYHHFPCRYRTSTHCPVFIAVLEAEIISANVTSSKRMKDVERKLVLLAL